MSRYNYIPLSQDVHEVRFLVLLPGGDGQPLQGLLTTRTFTDMDVDFEALSYVWGNPEKSASIMLKTSDTFVDSPDSQAEDYQPGKITSRNEGAPPPTASSYSQLRITTNLATALTYLRYSTAHVYYGSMPFVSTRMPHKKEASR